MRPTISQSLAVIMLSLTPAIIGAQSAVKQPDSQDQIPRELALALLNLGPGMGGADIRVGKAPDNIPSELLPPGFQILGSTMQFETTVIVLASPVQPDSAVSKYEAHLFAAGWTTPPTPPPQPMRGFVTADPGKVIYERPDGACRDDQFVTYTGTYRRNGGSLLKVTYNRNRNSDCKARQDVTPYRSPSDQAPIPLLRAPVGSIITESSGVTASGTGSFSLSIRLATQINPGQLVDHYNKQMLAQGWTSIANGSLQYVAARTYKKTDDQGRPWIGTLFSIGIPDSPQQDVIFKLIPPQPTGAK